MIVVLDTNILARGSISIGTAVAAIIAAWRAGLFTLVISTHILDELTRTLAKPYFAERISPATLAAYQSLLSLATLTPITVSLHRVATHPEDDLVLATAVSAAADYLVTRDRQLLKLGSYLGVAIVSPTELLEQLSA